MKMADTKPKEKICFVIGPIGAEGSPERNGADWLLEMIIKPVLEFPPFQYKVIRGDSVTEPGLITDQVISLAMDGDLVIADLTGHNANAFYELAIRHMEERATIHMAKSGEPLPFDIKDYRAIFYRLDHPKDIEKARNELAQQAEAVEAPGYKVANPITRARGHQQLARSSDSKEKIIADLVSANARITAQVAHLQNITSVLVDQVARRGQVQRAYSGIAPPTESSLDLYARAAGGIAAGVPRDARGLPFEQASNLPFGTGEASMITPEKPTSDE
jgi:hypothetical protein